jgi:hypothetical protein
MTQQDHRQQQREQSRYDYLRFRQLAPTPSTNPPSASSGPGANGRTMGGGHGMMNE